MLLLIFLYMKANIVATHLIFCQGIQSVNELHSQGCWPCFPALLHRNLRSNPTATQCGSSSMARIIAHKF